MAPVTNERRNLLGLALLATLVGCVSSEEPASTRAPIYGGGPTEECAWSGVVQVRSIAGLCSGVLIHPQVVATAGHCEGPGLTIRVGPSTGDSVSITPNRCVVHPNYASGTPVGSHLYYDIMVCQLDEPVANAVPIEPAVGCVADRVEGVSYASPREVVVLGYAGPTRPDHGTRRVATSYAWGFDRTPPHWPWLGLRVRDFETGAGICHGDSGGPDVVTLADGSARVVGIHSFQSGTEHCSNGAHTSTYLPSFLPWIEEEVGIDVTPCHDANDGRWVGGPECLGAYLAPAAGTAWPACPTPERAPPADPECDDHDAGVPDAATDGGTDAGGRDSSAPPVTDGGAAPEDARVTATVDASPPADASRVASETGSCACRTTPGPSSGPAPPKALLYGFLGACVLLGRRRLRRRAVSSR